MKLTWKQLMQRIGVSSKNLPLFSMLRNIVNAFPDKKRGVYERLFKTLISMDTDTEIKEAYALRTAANELDAMELEEEIKKIPTKDILAPLPEEQPESNPELYH